MTELHDAREVALVFLVHAGLREYEPHPPLVVVISRFLVVDVLHRLGRDALQEVEVVLRNPLKASAERKRVTNRLSVIIILLVLVVGLLVVLQIGDQLGL